MFNLLPEKVSIRAELAHRHRVSLLEVESLEALSRILVPEVEVPVRAAGCEGTVLVEGDRVHRVHRRLRALQQQQKTIGWGRPCGIGSGR